MATIHHNCEECDTDFKIEYDEMESESDPTYCPFCGEYMIETEFETDDE